jgi:hypothetical protein
MDYKKVIGFGGSLGVALILAAAGLHYDAKSLFYAGVILLAVVIVAWLFFWAHPMPQPVVHAADPDEARTTEEARERQERRRKIIDEARKMVSRHEINKEGNWRRTIQVNPAFAAVRPHLSRAYIDSLNSNMTVVTGREIHEISVDNFVSELDRLEREWGLS